ncbi:MAG: hypothetical protein RR015_06505, partial [Bacteroidales bacterium]
MRQITFIVIFSFIIASAQAKDKNGLFLNGNLPQSYMQDSLFSPQNQISDKWWKDFNDQALDSLITL